MFDPQTSGGLVLGVPEAKVRQVVSELTSAGVSPVAVIGEVTESHEEGLVSIV
jgi:selenide, water dikinase